jgi:phosphoglycerate dehydrogenase-like enzyme
MKQYKTVFTSERGERHRQSSLDAAPDILDVTMLYMPDRETLAAELRDADYLVSERVGRIDAELLADAPRLKLIQRLGSLAYDIDTEAAREAGVAVCTWPVGPVIRVSEHIVMQMLALSKRLRESERIALEASSQWGESRRTDEDTFAYNWSKRRDVDGLWQKTIGIIGFGEIGAELSRRLENFGVRLLYNKRRRLPGAAEAELNLTYAEAEALLVESDYVVNLLPFTSQTEMWLDGEKLALMKDGARLVSCGSGSVIDEQALAAAIRSGKLGGAALDTFEWEPLRPQNPLIALAREGYNVLLTPHIAAGAVAATAEARVNDYNNIMAHIEGRPLQYRIV